MCYFIYFNILEMAVLCNACGINYRRALSKTESGGLNLDRLAHQAGKDRLSIQKALKRQRKLRNNARSTASNGKVTVASLVDADADDNSNHHHHHHRQRHHIQHSAHSSSLATPSTSSLPSTPFTRNVLNNVHSHSLSPTTTYSSTMHCSALPPFQSLIRQIHP